MCSLKRLPFLTQRFGHTGPRNSWNGALSLANSLWSGQNYGLASVFGLRYSERREEDFWKGKEGFFSPQTCNAVYPPFVHKGIQMKNLSIKYWMKEWCRRNLAVYTCHWVSQGSTLRPASAVANAPNVVTLATKTSAVAVAKMWLNFTQTSSPDSKCDCFFFVPISSFVSSHLFNQGTYLCSSGSCVP